MPTLETLTEADLRGPLNTKSLRRARGYVHRVQDPVRAGQTLTAQVRGSRLYQVEIEVDPGGIHATCSCPYDWGGYCKHIGAVLLMWISSPRLFCRRRDHIRRGLGSSTPSRSSPSNLCPPFAPSTCPSGCRDSFEERQRASRQQLEDVAVSA